MKGALLLGVALALGACAMAGPGLAGDPTIAFTSDDPAMNAAIADARKTLPLFLAHVLASDGQLLRQDALLKVVLPTVPGSPVDGEHIWVSDFLRQADGSFVAILANEPDFLGQMKAGDQVAFTAEMISDWFVPAPSGRYWGSYTVRVMHAQGAFGDTPFDQVFEADPVPPDWQ